MDERDARPQALVDRFNRMVARDGGSLTLLDAGPDTIRVGYRVGAVDPECEDGSCVLPHVELQELMSETAARQLPGVRVQVEVMQ